MPRRGGLPTLLDVAAGRGERLERGDAGRRLEDRLRALTSLPLRVCVTDNLHTMISFGRSSEGLVVRLHRMFLRAPPAIQEALARYIRGAEPETSRILDRYIEAHRWMIRRVPVHERRRRVALRTEGVHHDLDAHFERLLRIYFGGRRLDCAVTWGNAPRVRLPRRTIKLGSYSADARLIRIHPALDQDWVPDYFVQWILFHEMLHHVHGVHFDGQRRRVHTPAFAADEERYLHLEAARRWEKENIDALLWWPLERGALRVG